MLRRNEKVEWIKHAPLFANLSKRDLAEVAHLADELDLREGKEMTRQGAPAREFFVLLEGEADVRKNGRRETESWFRSVSARVMVIFEEGRRVPSFRLLLLLPLVLAAVLLPGSAQSAAKDTNLTATVGPGFSIRLTDSSNQAVTHLDPGAYAITVKNLSPTQEHNFHLIGPGVNRATTRLGKTTATWRVKLKRGLYAYRSDATPSLKGSVRVR